MLRAVRMKFLFLFILTVISVVLVLPSFTTHLPDWWLKHVSRGLNLGLDLKGGMHLILQVDMDQAINNALSRAAVDLKETGDKRGYGVKVGDPAKEMFALSLLNKDEQAAFQKFLKEDFPYLEAQEPERQDGALVYTVRLNQEEVKQLEERTL